MVNPLTHSIPTYTTALKQLVDNNLDTLGVKMTFYGDQERLPTTPIVCAEPGNKSQIYKGGGINRQLGVTIISYLLVYSSLVASPQTNRIDSDILAENIEALIHQNRTLKNLITSQGSDDLVIECHVSEVQSGYVLKQNSLVRSSRITVEALTQNLLPS